MAEQIKSISSKSIEDCLYKAYKYAQQHKEAQLVKYAHDEIRGTHRILFIKGR